MGTSEPLLNSRDGADGPFVRWLEDLGLRDFIRRYPISRLIEWKWLVPQHSIRFPEDFFNSWKDYPYGGDEEHGRRHRLHHLLWDSEWFIDEHEPYWFLHPFFRPGDEAGRLLRESPQITERPEDVLTHENGRKIVPYAHFFFHWQGYALSDVIRFADCRVSLFNTPRIEQEAAGIVRIAERMKEIDPADILRTPKRWGGHAEPMTWLSHYRALRGAISGLDPGDRDRRRRGARLLAAHLQLTEDRLEAAIRDRLLVLADQWHWTGEPDSKWTAKAWPELQKDILLAVEWLCTLNGRTLDFYLDAWRHKHFGHGPYMELRKVLPFDSFRARDEFLELAPLYLEIYNKAVPSGEAFTQDFLKETVDRLRTTNYPFGGFLHAFGQLHDALTFHANDLKKLDLRARRPLDYYLLLAVRAETVLRYSLESSGTLSAMRASELDLKGYILTLARKLGLSDEALDQFRKSASRYTRLHAMPPNPMAEVMNMTLNLPPKEQYLVQAFLCSVLARNYFAHHYYLDEQLLNSKESQFSFGGILTTVLCLS